jgi:hypothetical protein
MYIYIVDNQTYADCQSFSSKHHYKRRRNTLRVMYKQSQGRVLAVSYSSSVSLRGEGRQIPTVRIESICMVQESCTVATRAENFIRPN